MELAMDISANLFILIKILLKRYLYIVKELKYILIIKIKNFSNKVNLNIFSFSKNDIFTKIKTILKKYRKLCKI